MVEGCLLAPGARPNSLSTPQFSIEVTAEYGCDNTRLGDPGRARGQPMVKAASPAPAMAMVWAADNSARPIAGIDTTSSAEPTGTLSLQSLACGDSCDKVARIRVVQAQTMSMGGAAETHQRMLYTNRKCKTEGCLCDARHGVASLTCHTSCNAPAPQGAVPRTHQVHHDQPLIPFSEPN